MAWGEVILQYALRRVIGPNVTTKYERKSITFTLLRRHEVQATAARLRLPSPGVELLLLLLLMLLLLMLPLLMDMVIGLK